MKDKEKQYISMKEMLAKRSIEPITNCNCKVESRIDYAVRKNEDNTGSMVDLLNQEQTELQKAIIEKIKLIIDERCEAELGQVHASSMGGKITKTVSTKLIAKDIYEYLTKDSVVLSREEYEKLKKFEYRVQSGVCMTQKEWFDFCNEDSNRRTCLRIEEREKERKETAEKLIKFVSEHCDNETLIWQIDEFIKTNQCWDKGELKWLK